MRKPNDFPITIDGMPVSELHVMQSGAGYYIGRSCLDPDCGGMEVPFSRESGYMTKTAAVEAMASPYQDWPVRDCVENNALYASGELPDLHAHREMLAEAEIDFDNQLMQAEFAAWSAACEAEEEADRERWEAEEQAWNDRHGDIPFG
jgi:hypothetical protein